MARTRIPDAILSAAHERSRARAAGDWTLADRLRGEIEGAGWTIVDRGIDFALSPTAPPDVVDGGRVRYGASDHVPSRLDEPATGPATVVLIATDWVGDVLRAVEGVRAHRPEGTSIVVVADAPAEDGLDALDALAGEPDAPEVVWTSDRLGHAAATNIGIRRASGEVVILLDPSVEPTGDFVTPLVRALVDPSVAVAGGWGITSSDLRTFVDAPAGDVDAIEGYCQAFRRSDAAAHGPLDERFTFYRNLDIWWSLVLRDAPGDRDGGADDGDTAAPRRAVSLADLPLVRHEHRGWTSLPEDEVARRSKRNFYRIINRFGSRRDLLVGSSDG